MASTAKAPALIVSQVGEPDRATGAVDYRATVTGCGLPISFSFTLPRYGLVTDIGDGTFRYTPMPRVNAQSDIFTVIADDGNGAVADSTVTWINDNRAPVAVAPPTVWPPDPATGAVTVSSNIVDPDGDPLTFTLETPHPRCGEVAIDRDGTFTYVPFPSARGHNGPAKETFGLRAADPAGQASTSPSQFRSLRAPPRRRLRSALRSAHRTPSPESSSAHAATAPTAPTRRARRPRVPW
jgi:Bacterial Ig domain